MGCDIHMMVERRGNDGNWQAVKGSNPRIAFYRELAQSRKNRGDTKGYLAYLKDAEEIESGEAFEKELEKYPDEDASYNAPEVYEGWVYDERNYGLFTILANVRASDDFAPISEPKGIPTDASDEYRSIVERWNGDGHSHSYFTLKELLDYDWNQTVRRYGIISEDQYRNLMDGILPTTWCGGIGGANIKLLDEVTMRDVIKNDWFRGMRGLDRFELYTSASWNVSCADAVKDFVEGSIPKLEQLADSDPESVRIVFFFDN